MQKDKPETEDSAEPQISFTFKLKCKSNDRKEEAETCEVSQTVPLEDTRQI